jgi:enoyl-CoA hydratase/carnithine racemase
MSEKELLIDRIGDHILKVTINRPEKRNAVNGAVTSGIDEAVKLSERERDIRVVVFTSTGDKSFCAGADLSLVLAGRTDELTTDDGGFAGLIQAKRTKPWIAAVDAPALGGGTEICLTCEMVVASRRAAFGLPEVKLGVAAAAGGMVRLPKRIPPAIAYEMLATGEPITAERAYEIGLANKIVDAGKAVDAAIELAEKIVKNAPVSVQETLKVAKLTQDFDEAELFEAMLAAGAIVRQTEDFMEGPRAFMEKRKPVWKGQ